MTHFEHAASESASAPSSPYTSTADTATVATAPIFVGGAGRSGTTLLRVILDTHSRIACGPEIKVIPVVANLWAQFQTTFAPYLAEAQVSAGDVDRAFQALIAGVIDPLRRHAGKPRVAEKTPNNVFFFRHLHRMFPEATYVHVVRDGRDVVASLLTMDWRGPDGQRIDYTTDATLAARYWANSVIAARSFQSATQGQSRFFELRYEDLVARPESCLRALFDYLGEPWEPQVLAYHHRERSLGSESSAEAVRKPIYSTATGRWRTDLDAAQRAAVKREAGKVLVELGYCRDLDW